MAAAIAEATTEGAAGAMADFATTEEDISREEAIEDAKYEQLLTEKLLDGYVLMEAVCPNPKCSIPLVKNNKGVPRTLSRDENDPTVGNIDSPVVVPSQSFEQPFQPVSGVPMCVGCNSHVITQEMELAILEDSDALTDKGSVYVALQAQGVEALGLQAPPAPAEEPQKPAMESVPEDAATEQSTQPEQQPEEEEPKPEIINLEDVTEDDVLVGAHRGGGGNYFVDIAASSFDLDGVSNVEVFVSPKAGDAEKPIDVEQLQENEDDEVVEKSIRREIATKVLGAKMLQGWTLKEKTCDSCAMPMMEHKGKEDCHVCPALAKRAAKKLKQQQRIAVEKERLSKEVAAKKDAARIAEQVQEYEEIQTLRGEIEVKAIAEDEEATQRAEERKKAIDDQKDLLLKMQETQKKMQERDQEAPAKAVDPAAVEEEATRERARIVVEEEQIELERLEAIANEEDQRRTMKAEVREKEEELASKEAEQKALQEAAAKKLAEEKAAIEAFDESTMADDKTEAMKKDRLVEEHRKNMADKITLDDQVARLEEERIAEGMEVRRLAEERRIESENRMIAALEADAALKALAAEEAIKRAKEALSEVTSTKSKIIAQTIEMAEKEAVAETEETLKSRFEEHSEPVVLKTQSEIYMERWETLRLESRAIMTRRVMQGWAITPEACVVEECHNSPLIELHGKRECTVCGGCGDGTDVAALKESTEEASVRTAPTPTPATVRDALVGTATTAPTPVERPVVDNSAENLYLGVANDVEKNREKYIKQIGKKLLDGWILTDSVCDTCVMPLMMDEKGNEDLCIACGDTKLINKQQHTFDASTIATKDMATLEDDRDPIPDRGRSLSPVEETQSPAVDSIPSNESDLVSRLQSSPKKSQRRGSQDPPAFKPTLLGEIPVVHEEVIPLPDNVDFADADAIRQLVGFKDQDFEDSGYDTSITTVANLFLKSPHGYDFQDFGKSMDVEQVKELVEIFLVTNVDQDVSDSFKLTVAKRILSTMNFGPTSPAKTTTRRAFNFDDEATKPRAPKSRPYPEFGSGSPRRPMRSPASRRVTSPVVIGMPTSPRSMSYMRSPREDGSVFSRASTVASEAMESIYDRIDQCKEKLLDPNNNLDEQIATAALLEKLAQAAVAVKQMDDTIG